MAPKHESSDAGNSDVPKRSYKMPLLIKKMKVLKKTKSYAEAAKTYGMNKFSINVIVKKEKETHACFVIVPQTANVKATIHEKSFGKMKKTLNYRV